MGSLLQVCKTEGSHECDRLLSVRDVLTCCVLRWHWHFHMMAGPEAHTCLVLLLLLLTPPICWYETCIVL